MRHFNFDCFVANFSIVVMYVKGIEPDPLGEEAKERMIEVNHEYLSIYLAKWNNTQDEEDNKETSENEEDDKDK
jgi:hypothetical protein